MVELDTDLGVLDDIGIYDIETWCLGFFEYCSRLIMRLPGNISGASLLNERDPEDPYLHDVLKNKKGDTFLHQSE